MLKVYCDTGGYRPELSKMESEGLILVLQWKYENQNKKIKHKAAPSQPSWKEMNYPSWKRLDGLTWDDLAKTSDKRGAIEELLGPANIRDAKHLDSAYMRQCHAFITSDKDDIVSRRVAIERLLNIKVFHARDDWQAFCELVRAGA